MDNKKTMSTKKEINRMIKYAEGLGIKIIIEPYVNKSAISAEWIIDENDNVSICLYKKRIRLI